MGLLNYLEKSAEKRRETEIEVFEGEVEIITQNLKYTTYRVLDNDAIIKANISAHVRLVPHQWSLPPSFEVLAPLKYVRIVKGRIPSYLIRTMLVGEYTDIRKYFYSMPKL